MHSEETPSDMSMNFLQRNDSKNCKYISDFLGYKKELLNLYRT